MGKNRKISGLDTCGYKWALYFVCIVASLGGLLFGLGQGFIANSFSTIQKVYNAGIIGGEHYAASLAWGAIIGAIVSGFLARKIGRKNNLIFIGFIFCISSLISAMLPSFYILILCRFILGLVIGVASLTVPLYLSEIAPARIRGTLGTLFQFMVTFGIFLVSFINVTIVKNFPEPRIALPAMFILIGLLALLMYLGTFIIPESPRWLVFKNRRLEAERIFQEHMKSTEEIDLVYNEITSNIKNIGSGKNVLNKRYFIKILLVGIFLQMFGQLVGINLIIYYAPTIFGYAGIYGNLANIIAPMIFVIFTIFVIILADKLGRRKLLYIGSVVMFLTTLVIGFSFLYMNNNVNLHLVILPKIFLLTSVLIYVIAYAISWGPLAWLMCSEIFPFEKREFGMTITTMTNWCFAGVVMYNSLSFMKHFGNALIFFIFALFCLLSLFFVKFLVPETKGITLEKFEENLRAGIPLRNLGNSKDI